MTVRIDRLDAAADAGMVASQQRLLAQLSSSAPPLTAERLGDMLGNDAACLSGGYRPAARTSRGTSRSAPTVVVA